MRPIRKTGWLVPLAMVALSLSLGASARADVCVVVNPVLDIGCREGQGAPAVGSSTPSSEAAGAPSDSGSESVPVSSTEPRYDPDSVAVTFHQGTPRDAALRAIRQAGGSLERAVPKLNAYLVHVEPAQRADVLAALREKSSVKSATQEVMSEALDVTPDDSAWPLQTGLRVAGFPAAWDITQGSNVIVAVVDTGVDGRHPDLQGAVVPGYDFANGDTNPMDDHGHGTAVAGVIAARADNHLGGAGICWRCLIMPVKVLDANGSGDDTVIAAGIVWAVDHGAKVINLSLGGPGASQELTNAIGYATGKGVVVVAAAGNSGTTTQFYPAADPRALSVAATTTADQRYSWSNYGSWVRVAAPGCNVAPVLGGGYGNFCGTSSATPLVTGLIALELSAQPSATPQQLEQAITSAARPLPDVVEYGRIDAGRTLGLLSPATSAKAVFNGTLGPRIARERSYSLDVADGLVTAVLSFTGAKRLTLSSGSARITGTSPLRLANVASAGRQTFRVGGDGRSRTTFVLTVTYAK
jgi:subtilisin family serine protease